MALLFAAFPTNALTGQSLDVSYGYCTNLADRGPVLALQVFLTNGFNAMHLKKWEPSDMLIYEPAPKIEPTPFPLKPLK